MKLFGISIKREYVLYFLDPRSKSWFFDEPKINKKDLSARIEWLKHGQAEIKIRTRYTIEI